MISNKTATVEGSAAVGKSEGRNPKTEVKPAWWVALPAGERAVIRAVADVLRQAKESASLDMARAGTKWERALGCFIKVRLKGEMGECRRIRRQRLVEMGGKRS